MRVLVSGASGFIGGALTPALAQAGHQVAALTRRPTSSLPSVVTWDPERGILDPVKLDGIEGIVHLAGESIVGRWTRQKKERILYSRVLGTKLLAQTAARLGRPPKVFLSASAIGFYGDRGEEVLEESSPSGHGFLSDVAQAWEAATAPAAAAGIRVAHLRIGVVLSPKGGALAKMLTPFRLGLGGVIGTGRQWWSWVSLDDLVGAVRHALETPAVSGPVNVTAPTPVTNREFTRTLGRVLGRPAVLPLPAFAARLLMGEMADALLLSSARVEPKALTASGYRFRFPDLEAALRHALAS